MKPAFSTSVGRFSTFHLRVLWQYRLESTDVQKGTARDELNAHSGLGCFYVFVTLMEQCIERWPGLFGTSFYVFVALVEQCIERWFGLFGTTLGGRQGGRNIAYCFVLFG